MYVMCLNSLLLPIQFSFDTYFSHLKYFVLSLPLSLNSHLQYRNSAKTKIYLELLDLLSFISQKGDYKGSFNSEYTDAFVISSNRQISLF